MYIVAFVKWCSDSVSSPWQEGQSPIRWSQWSTGKQRLMDPILYLREFSHYSQRCHFLPHVLVDLAVEGGRMQDGEHTPHGEPVTCRSAGAWFLIFCITLHEHKLQYKCSRRSMLQVCKSWWAELSPLKQLPHMSHAWTVISSLFQRWTAALPCKSYRKFFMFMSPLEAA